MMHNQSVMADKNYEAFALRKKLKISWKKRVKSSGKRTIKIGK
jgi:hypothetical protein